MKIISLPICLAFLSALSISLSAQIYNGDIVLTTQAEVDSFQVNYGSYTGITGSLNINGTQIENLDSLYSLIFINSRLSLAENEQLTSIEGLNNLVYIGNDLKIVENPLLTSLEGLRSLTAVQKDLFIQNTPITDLGGLNNLESIGLGLALIELNNLANLDSLESLTTIGQWLLVFDNPGLQNVDALEQVGPIADYIDFSQNPMLLNVDGIKNAAVSLESHLAIVNNDMITNIDSLYNLNYVGGTLRISNNDSLRNVNGLGNLDTLDGTLYVRNNEKLESIDSLLNLTYIGEHLWIEQNPSLVDLFGLSNLTEIRGYLRIKLNDLLPSIVPLSQVDTIYSFVEIIDNSALDECCIIKCWPYEVTQSSITIQNNDDNCSSMLKIYDVCDTLLCDGQITLVDMRAYLEGPYRTNLGEMHTDLNDLDMDIIAVRQPYNNAPYNYGGGEVVSLIPPDMVDWVLVEARTGEPKITGSRGTVTVETKAGLMMKDGTILGPDGVLPLQFFYLEDSTEYYFCIRHRNHLDVLTATPTMHSDTISYDFTTAQEQAYGAQQLKQIDANTFGMYVADYNQDNVIQSTDIDLWLLKPAVLNTYSNTDGNIDGVIQVTDYDKWFFNKAKIGSVETQYD